MNEGPCACILHMQSVQLETSMNKVAVQESKAQFQLVAGSNSMPSISIELQCVSRHQISPYLYVQAK